MTIIERIKDVIAQGCTTYSKRYDQYIEGVHPVQYPDDIYMDMVCGLGSNLYGFDNNNSLPCKEELELCEMLKEKIPCMERMRILKTGSEACQAAIRIARAYNKREIVLGSGYHGWHNIFISAENPGAGTHKEGYFKLDSIDNIIKSIGKNVSAVIIEPVQLDMSSERHEELMRLEKACKDNGVVLIYDEVITGLRVPSYCVTNYWQLSPDILCMGKAMGNGYPIAVVGGRKELMDNDQYFISSTFAGEKSAIVESLKTIKIYEKNIEECWEISKDFQFNFNRLSPRIQLVGYGTRCEWRGDSTDIACFWQEMWIRHRVLCGRTFMVNMIYTEGHLDWLYEISIEIISDITAGKVKLKGKLPRPVFKRN